MNSPMNRGTRPARPLIASLAASCVALLLALPVIRAQERREEPPPKSKSKGKTTSKSAPPARGAAPSQTPERGNERSNVPPARGPAAPAPAAGINRVPAPAGRPTPGVGRPLPQGARVVPTRGGGAVTMRANGRPAVVHTANGLDIHHSLTGRTEIVRESPDHSRIVAVRPGFGYVQHAYVYGGHPYLARTTLIGGRPYESFYRGYPFRGAYLEVYAPVRFYPLGFYGYVGTPWARPIAYGWGWGIGTPWFAFYGGYFTPYPVYAGPPLWLTDYLIAQSLNNAYQAQMAQQAAAQAGAYPPPQPPLGGPAGMTPEVKQAIADEVSRQLAQENAEARLNAQGMEPDPAASGIAGMLSDGTPHVFVVGDGLDLIATNGQECAVTDGDVLQLAGPTPPNAPAATLIVMASKGGLECRKGSSVTVQLTDLQDMQNHMRETLDAGLADLQAHQGGLPTPPQATLAMAVPASFTMGAPPPDPTVATQVNAELQQGAQAEQQTLAEAGSAPPPLAAGPQAAAGAPPATVTLGQSIDQVTAILGQPTQVVDLGAKKIYVYPSLKITFNNGQVADVE